MKKLLILMFCLINVSFANDFSGKYLCNGYDTKDGVYNKDYVTLKLVNEHSYAKKDLYSYLFELKNEKGILQYSGFAASNGNNLSIYFENVNKNNLKTREDRGVGIASVADTMVRNSNGKFVNNITFDKFYFEPTYPSDGSETCLKI